MAKNDQTRWDDRYADHKTEATEASLPDLFAVFAERFGTAAHAIEIACGAGRSAVWLATKGVSVVGYDISRVALETARSLAARHRVTDRCRFEVADLDEGLPPGDPVDLILCHLFRDPSLDGALVERLAPGGTLAVAALSEVGATPGRFRAVPGELLAAFGDLEVVEHGEGDGLAWLVATKP